MILSRCIAFGKEINRNPSFSLSFQPKRIIIKANHSNNHSMLFMNNRTTIKWNERVSSSFSSSMQTIRFISTEQKTSNSTTRMMDWAGKLLNKVAKDTFSEEELSKHSSSQRNSSNTNDKQRANPFKLVESDLQNLKENISKMLEHTQHPLLKTVAGYYVHLEGKRIRPLILLVLAKALASHQYSTMSSSLQEMGEGERKQLQLAEIVEMIHTASIVHDDVIDNAVTRRGLTSVNLEFGNKLAILSGDFLLARASVALAKLQNHEVTRLISEVISDLVEGELMQIKPSPSGKSTSFDYYLQKTYFKTASLIANGCASIALLSNSPPELVSASTEYGRNLGIAFQLIDDLLDFTECSDTLGKQASVDLTLGLATAPVLFAREEFPELSALIARKFEQEGDVQLARSLVSKSKGLALTRKLAEDYIEKSLQSIEVLKE
eukprot:TRINITY_DN2936_c0_g2_i1.p1 TRINITY_DN2936_c0_g2~~TRINITY_DN2936_c0_g2_i1.p1  ORF type:complete len:436 (-),score=95.67 TRINITY_DN2936_c0_g2_i1:115-1422(-)